MNLLCIDSSTRTFSIAVTKDKKVVAYRNLVLDKVLSSSIVPAVEKILQKANTSFEQLDGYAVGLGPGSFTSLRVGLSTVKAFVLASGKPVVGIPSLDVIARGCVHLGFENICVISDAKRKKVFAAIYQVRNTNLKQQGEYLLTDINSVLQLIRGKTCFTGDGLSLFRKDIVAAMKKDAVFADEKFWYPQAKMLAQLSYQKFADKKFDDADRLVPLYLYPRDCQVVSK